MEGNNASSLPTIVPDSPNSPAEPCCERKRFSNIPWLLFLFLAGLYLLTARGTHTSVDDTPRYNLTIALVLHQTFEIPPSVMAAATRVDGRIYCKYGIGQSLLMIPLFWIGEGIGAVAPEPLVRLMERPYIFAMSTLNQWLGAAAVALLFLIARRTGFGEKTALLVALAAGTSSMLWLNSQTSFDNLLATVLIEVVVLALLSSEPLQLGAAVAGGLAMGGMFLTRWADGWVMLPAVAALWAAQHGRRPARINSALSFWAAAAAGLALTMAYNYARFYDPFELGYDDDNMSWRLLPSGLFGFLFSPTKSIFLFSPLLLPALAGMKALWRRLGGGIRAGGFFWLLGAPLAAYSCFETWDGGWCFGPRYLLPSATLAFLALGEWLEREPVHRTFGRSLSFLLLLLLGIYAQVICLASNFNEYYDGYYPFRWEPDACPLVVCATGFARPAENLWFWKLLADEHAGLAKLVVLLPLTLLSAGLYGLRAAFLETWADWRAGAGRGVARKIAFAGLTVLVLLLLPAMVRAMRDLQGGETPPSPRGLLLRLYALDAGRWTGLGEQPVARLDVDWSGRRRPVRGDFRAVWEGWLAAPAEGLYRFALDSCGTATLTLGGKTVLVNSGPQPGRRMLIQSLFLTAGDHALRVEYGAPPEVEYVEIGGARYGRTRHLPVGVTLRWRPPGELFLRTIPARSLRQP
ncbi:MAG: PA14 domain-containing protein [Candidatus Sumerlaeia bacterium]|nr:PA14 domain-containing protein [Candidatus Sumerlaeia bacterium]